MSEQHRSKAPVDVPMVDFNGTAKIWVENGNVTVWFKNDVNDRDYRITMTPETTLSLGSALRNVAREMFRAHEDNEFLESSLLTSRKEKARTIRVGHKGGLYGS